MACGGAGAIAPGVTALDRQASDRQIFDCQTCGACCAYSREWPRFSLEDDAALARIPARFVDDAQGRMRCDGDRCTALVGEIGVATACAVYAVRPDVCVACQPGDAECRIARRRFNL
jgi:Fe-S-cluster containining protein